LELDDFKELWLSQNRKIDAILQINRRLQLRAELTGPRAWLRWFRFGALVEILLGFLCLLWTGSFIYAHFGELRFLAAAAALHLWLVGAVGTAIVRYVRAGVIDYGAPVLLIQRQVESLRLFAMRSLRFLFVTGVVVWAVPFPIVAFRALFGVDLYAAIGAPILGMTLIGSAALGFAVVMVCSLCVRHFGSSLWLRQSARALSGYSLNAAADQLLKLATFEREP
jgi:hypothetical protein